VTADGSLLLELVDIDLGLLQRCKQQAVHGLVDADQSQRLATRKLLAVALNCWLDSRV
jgi:hypothetical protein